MSGECTKCDGSSNTAPNAARPAPGLVERIHYVNKENDEVLAVIRDYLLEAGHIKEVVVAEDASSTHRYIILDGKSFDCVRGRCRLALHANGVIGVVLEKRITPEETTLIIIAGVVLADHDAIEQLVQIITTPRPQEGRPVAPASGQAAYLPSKGRRKRS